MARRNKRASMREGPLADLFRSTEAPDDPPEPPDRPEPRREREPEPEAAADPDPEPEPAPRARDEGDASARPAKDRLRDVFTNEPDDREPAYGRSEPSRTPATATPQVSDPLIRVVGVGGGGVNAVNRMVEAGITGVEFMAVNTDLQSLQQSAADLTIHIGGGVTRGLGSGSDPELGYRAAFEEQDRIKRMLKGSDMVFVAAGAGGGTGTGAAPVIARLARDVGALTVGIVTRPFGFEGTRRAKQADKGIDALAGEVDTLIVVPNDRLLSVLERNTSMVEAFRVADDVLRQGVQGISDLITLPA
ncbi:MAG TPA: cell division protein FtsZ, partial [Solirubrobacterales bacterium]|nr:cell division protein FtsZ [Solirubrobacterales bacterium]